MNSFGTWVMRSVDEVFRPVLPEPNLVSESPQGYSQSLTVGPQFQSQTDLTQTFFWLDCGNDFYKRENILHSDIQEKKKTYRYINTDLSFLATDHQCLSSPCVLLFLLLDRVSGSPARFCYITRSMDTNVFSVNNSVHQFFHGKNKRGYREKA